ncbi:MAG: hypothetical protein ABEJ92_00925, partial [Halobacteriales archaeon]
AGVSAGSAVALVGLGALGADRVTLGVVGLFGVVCPMAFGMAYVLLPPYVGRTFPSGTLPALHFAATIAGAALVVGRFLHPGLRPLFPVGVLLWSLGVGLFVAGVARTAGQSAVERVRTGRVSTDHPQRSPRIAAAAIPLAMAYLLAGTVGLLGYAGLLPPAGSLTLPAVLHLYGAGFGALLVFALGARLLTGFFHVTPPRVAVVTAVVAGAIGPAFLASHRWVGPWFRIGAGLETAALLAYAAGVAVVAIRTDWRRPGLSGILLGAVAGAAGVVVAGLVVLGGLPVRSLEVHAALLLEGFFVLTIVGYAYQFFPVTSGRYAGATERTAVATIALLAGGLAVRLGGTAGGWPLVTGVGGALGLAGALGYTYLLGRRLVGR